MTERKPKSQAMAAALEAAQGLASLGVITPKTLRGYEKRCAGDAPAAKSAASKAAVPRKQRPVARVFLPADIAKLRAKVHASQGYFAMQLQVSPTTVQQWESGAKTPSPMAAKLLDVVDKHGLEILA